MKTEIQLKIKSNENYLRYLRENSYWYKYLNRNPIFFKQFESEVKEKYKLTGVDRISKTLDTISMLEKVISTLK